MVSWLLSVIPDDDTDTLRSASNELSFTEFHSTDGSTKQQQQSTGTHSNTRYFECLNKKGAGQSYNKQRASVIAAILVMSSKLHLVGMTRSVEMAAVVRSRSSPLQRRRRNQGCCVHTVHR
jgi:hypothetical protein